MSGYSYGARSIWQRPDAVEALRDALSRKLSAGEAAKELSTKFDVPITRNSIIGKASRLGIPLISERKNAGWFKPSDKPKAKPQKLHKTVFCFRPTPAGPTAPVAEFSMEPIPIPVSRRVSLLDLTHTSCRWPIGDVGAAGFGFCGANRVKPDNESNAYCADHAAIAYRPTGEVNMRPVKQANSTRAGVQE